jgi:ferrochelatase
MIGLLLVNLGTPDAPDTAAVRRYLRQFLSDPRVIDIHPALRFLLLNLIILPLRPRRSAAAYRQIWGPRGSPLLLHGQDLAAALRERLPGWAVELGMRYGNPSIEAALSRLRAAGAEPVVVLPLFPQYSSAATGSAIEEVCRVAAGRENVPHLSFVSPFYDDPGFIEVFAARGAAALAEGADHVIFSFHGLPERQVRRADESGGRCLARPGCCDAMTAENRMCYRAQCHETARLLAKRLGIEEGSYSVTFQSRLGRTVWIRPYTDVVLGELARAGKKRVVVFCPAFVADCLETLEEVGLRGRELFLAAGGESLTLVPSLNAGGDWADAVVAMLRRQAARLAG